MADATDGASGARGASDPADGDEGLGPGVRAIDHTADVGLEIGAPDLPALFARAAAGLEGLIGDRSDPNAPAPDARQSAGTGELLLELDAPDVALLLADWLRELLYLRQVRRRALARVEFEELSETRLGARVATVAAPAHPVREIKGVTYHGLDVRRAGDGWRARVIFDV